MTKTITLTLEHALQLQAAARLCHQYIHEREPNARCPDLIEALAAIREQIFAARDGLREASLNNESSDCRT